MAIAERFEERKKKVELPTMIARVGVAADLQEATDTFSSMTVNQRRGNGESFHNTPHGAERNLAIANNHDQLATGQERVAGVYQAIADLVPGEYKKKAVPRKV